PTTPLSLHDALPIFDPARAEAMAQLATTLATQYAMARLDSSVHVDRSADGKSVAPRKLDSPFEKDCEFGRMIFQSPLPQLIHDRSEEHTSELQSREK